MVTHYTPNLHIESKRNTIKTKRISGRKEMKLSKDKPTRRARKSRIIRAYPRRRRRRRWLSRRKKNVDNKMITRISRMNVY
jgi:hypothetical protein